MEYEYLEKVTVTDGPFDVIWSAHHASQKRGKPCEISITMHVMDKIRKTVVFLNPSQVPVITADQPIYEVAKQVQWHLPGLYGKVKFVIMLGGLHIEIATLKSIGILIKDNGWIGALVEAGIASSGAAD